jgi:hypothetical protein
VKATSISLASEPARPEPGAVATLVITVSGQNGADKYGVSGKNVDLVLKQSPGSNAKLDATSVTTNASGAATVKLTLSQTRGRHVVDATSKSLATEWVTDTLAGANLVSRARHGGEIDAVPVAAPNNAAIFFVGAGFVLLLGFAWPYLIGLWRSRRWQGPRRAGLRTSPKFLSYQNSNRVAAGLRM